MNKDNDLDWIGGWAKWHALAHGVDAVIVFDNGSTRYGIAEIEAALAGISGIRTICVLDWPFKYGRKDPALLDHPHYPHFLQIASLNVTLRRFASKAQGLLNCDVDELVGTNGQGSAFKQLRLAPQGIITLAGRWVETIADGAGIAGIAHTNYRSTHRLGMLSVCADKWIIDPSQPWLAPLEAKPSVHRIYDVDRRIGRSAPRLPFWHFKAINTNWKQKRTSPSRFNAAFHRRLTSLDHEIERVLGK